MPTAAEYIDKLWKTITLAGRMWDHYGWAASKAYTRAYHSNQNVLTQVKKEQEFHKKMDELFMSLGLSFLTVGVAGGLAGWAARDLAANYFKKSKVAEDVAKDMLKYVQQKEFGLMTDLAAYYLSYDVASNDVFAPSDTTPDEYTDSLFEGISYRVALLTKIAYETEYDPRVRSVNVDGNVFKLKSGGELSADDARRLTDAILDTTFIKEMPPLEVNVPSLQRKASLALWIGWALARDAAYWSGAKYPRVVQYTKAYEEQFDWEPVRQNLRDLGVSEPSITAYGTEYHWGNRTSSKKGLWMWGFMKWASSQTAIDTLFDPDFSKQANALGLEKVRKKMLGRHLTDNGWINVDVDDFMRRVTGTHA